MQQSWLIIIAILISSLAQLAFTFLGAWIVWRCWKTEPLIPDKEIEEYINTDASENEDQPEDDDPERDFDEVI